MNSAVGRETRTRLSYNKQADEANVHADTSK